jgi:hypothetical protein
MHRHARRARFSLFMRILTQSPAIAGTSATVRLTFKRTDGDRISFFATGASSTNIERASGGMDAITNPSRERKQAGSNTTTLR